MSVRSGIVGAVALAAAFGVSAPGVHAVQGVGPPIGTQAPAAALEDLDGNTVQLLDYVEAGKPTLIEFWATWCENCEALQPQMDRIYAEHGSQINVVAVAVAVSQSIRRVKRHLDDHNPGYPYLWDVRGEAVRAYAAPTTSVIVLMDENGKVVYTGSGSGQNLIAEVGKVLGRATSEGGG